MKRSPSIVNAIFGGAKAKVVSCLYMQNDANRLLGARVIARESHVPYGSIDRALRDLVRDGLVVRFDSEDGPKYRAPFDDQRLHGLFEMVRYDSDLVEDLTQALDKARGVQYAAIFGSFASGKAGRTSDIDVLVIESDPTERFAVMSILGKVGDRTDRQINPEFYGGVEFERKLEEGDPVAMSIMSNPRIDLKGRAPWSPSGN
jgi:predicted nucleotidyltransferase